MAQQLLYHFWMHTLTQQQRSGSVTQIVKTNVGKTSLDKKLFEMNEDATRVEMFS